ncbi:MAG: NEW3 domain-containing protein [bacterium]
MALRSAALILALLLAPALAASQVPAAPSSASVDVRVQDAKVTLSLDAPAVTDVFVTNTAAPNPALPQLDQPRRVTLEITGVPEGWTASVQPNSFDLGPGKTGNAVLTVSVSAAADAKVANLNVTAKLYPLGVSAIPGAGPTVDPEARDAAGVTATRQDSLGRTITEQVGPYIFLLLGAFLLALVAVVVLLVLRGRSAVRLACDDGELVAAAGGKAEFVISVTNISGRDDGVALRVTAPEGWSASFSQGQFELPANSEGKVTLTVKVPKTAQSGERVEVAVVVVSALPRKSSGIRLTVRVK